MERFDSLSQRPAVLKRVFKSKFILGFAGHSAMHGDQSHLQQAHGVS